MHQHTTRSDLLATPSPSQSSGVSHYTHRTPHTTVCGREQGSRKNSRHTHTHDTIYSAQATRSELQSYYVALYLYIADSLYVLCGLFMYVLLVPQQYIVPTPIYIYTAFPLLQSTVATRYCHNHITTAVADIIIVIYIYIHTCRLHKPFSFGKPYVIYLCAPLLLCKCSIGCYAARQRQHTRAYGYASHAGARAHRPRNATPKLRRCFADTAQRDIPG